MVHVVPVSLSVERSILNFQVSSPYTQAHIVPCRDCRPL